MSTNSSPPSSNPAVSSLPWWKPLVVLVGAMGLFVLLFPLMARGREDRRHSVCISNLSQIGLGLQQYLQDYDGILPVSYHYNNRDPKQKKGLDDTGIVHWSALILPYMKEQSVFVCPDDSVGGQPPTNFRAATDNQGMGVPEGAQSGASDVQDAQAPRLSYTANEQLMPRPRGGVGNVFVGQKQNLVKSAMVEAPSQTIAITEFTDHINAVSGGGPGGVKFKSHRPSSALVMDKAGKVAYDTSDPITTLVYAISPEAARALFAKQADVEFGSKTEPHLIYVNSGRHRNTNNFLFLDGHVSAMKVEETLSCDKFLWGIRLYNQGNASVSCAATGKPVR